MHEVVKISVFLFIKLATTTLDLPLGLKYFPVPTSPQTSLPIATDWDMFYATSSVNRTTDTSHTPTHHSSPSLHLTSPNLYLPKSQTL
jgi:hypothetical protein